LDEIDLVRSVEASVVYTHMSLHLQDTK